MDCSSSSLRIRPLEGPDQRAVAELERACFRHPWTREVVTAELEHPAVFARGGESAGKIVAYSLFRRAGVEAELARIAVAPALRGRGLARRLLATSLEELERGGILETFLEVRTSNRAALALYENLDFRPVGRRASYYPDGTDALVLRRDRSSAPIRTTS